MEDIVILRKRLRYQSQHRGMREMDLLFGAFAEQKIPQMNIEELKQFEDLLALPDPALHKLLTTEEPPTTPLVQAIRAFKEGP